MESEEELKRKIQRLQMIGWTIEDIQRFTKLKPSVIRKLSNPIFNED
jgi:hypothetical protein